MKHSFLHPNFIAISLGLLAATHLHAEISLLAVGSLDQSRAGAFTDLSGLNYQLENQAPANLLGGLGSGIAYASGNTFLALPDRGPNAVGYDAAIDDTVSYINRFHTISMDLRPNTSGSGLPYTLTPTLRATTLLWSLTPLVYGTGNNLGVGSGVPRVNNFLQHYFTGRSDNFDPNRNSGDHNDARFDTEGIRMSNDGLRVYISDEYGPYIYEFSRFTGVRLRTFTLPASFYVPAPSSVGNNEIGGNTVGRTANKGMEGLAITPDGRTLVGIMQNALLQDANVGATKLLRIVTIDLLSGHVTHQFAYLLTAGSGVSEIVALNNHEFLVDERDGNGRGSANNAKTKQLFKISLEGAVDISAMDGPTASTHGVDKTLFLNIVTTLLNNGFTAAGIPAKIEGLAFGPDIGHGNNTVHTLWIANDNDFLSTVPDADGNQVQNSNQFFVFGFHDTDLGTSKFVQQQFWGDR